MGPKLSRRAFNTTMVAGAGLCFAKSAAADEPIKLGFNSDMSATATSEYGIAGRAGVEAAIADINAQGGLLGRQVTSVIRDDLGSPPKSIQNMIDLIDNERVSAVLGPANSGNALAWLHIPQQKKIPVMGFAATATEITARYTKEPQNYMFRISMVDRDQQSLLAAYAVKASKSRIGIMADTTGYGQGVAKDLVAILALHGIQNPPVEKFGPNDTDMTSQLSKLKAADVDVIIAGSLGDANGQILRSMDKMDYFPKMLCSWGSLSTPIWNIAGKLAERVIIAASTTEDSNERARALYQRLIKQNPRLPVFVAAAQAYDGVMMLAAAMKQAGSTDGEKMQHALENLPEVDGIVKTYRYPFTKENHEALGVADFYYARWSDGHIVRVDDDITRSLIKSDFK
jgi:branched-chain amino acid transport system substrate-binding protein